MTSNQFEVTTASLRAAAGSFGGHADSAGQIAEHARAADVDMKSWGALGLGLGMYAGYSSARTSAERSIGEVKAFLTDAKTALESSARDYDDADQAGGKIFDDIHNGMGGGAS